MKPIQLKVYTYSLGLDGTQKEIHPFHKAIKNCVEKFEDEDFHGSCRIFTESADGKRWELKIVTPPIPSNHRLVHTLEGMIQTASYDKRVYSWGSTDTEAVFK